MSTEFLWPQRKSMISPPAGLIPVPLAKGLVCCSLPSGIHGRDRPEKGWCLLSGTSQREGYTS